LTTLGDMAADRATAAREAALGALLARVIPEVAAGQAEVMQRGNPASVLALRHALRSLRMLLALLQREAPSPQLADLRDKARRMTAALGPVRSLDAFRLETLPRARKRGLGRIETSRLAAGIRPAREAALAAARAELASDALHNFASQLAALPAVLTPATVIRRRVADALLGRQHRRMLRLGAGFPGDADSEARHRLRLAGKALVDLGALLTKDLPLRRRALRRAARLTAEIGRARDYEQALAIIEGIVEPSASAALAKVLARAEADEEERLRRRWRAFRRASPPAVRR
jgi:hypothetical protein